MHIVERITATRDQRAIHISAPNYLFSRGRMASVDLQVTDTQTDNSKISIMIGYW